MLRLAHTRGDLRDRWGGWRVGLMTGWTDPSEDEAAVADTPPEGLVAFCEREYPQLVGTLTLYCGDRGVAAELAQEALATVCERWERVEHMAAPGAWVHRVAINAANSQFRRRAAERRARQRLLQGGVEQGQEPDRADVVAVRREIARLPSRQAEVVVLRYYLRLTVAETAARMGRSEAAVKSLMHRASARLRQRLGDGPAQADVQEVDDVAH